MAHRNDERYYEAELYRLKGELLLMQVVAFRRRAERLPLKPGSPLLVTPSAASIRPSRSLNNRKRSPWNYVLR